ncbi:MAG: gliding motility-associated C-terminal domain-containing protein [Bacteroidota bacterium]
MLKKLLLFIVLFVTACLNAQTFYWVGGSGYWNDIAHWSYTSGGTSSNILPSGASTVVFDNASSASSFTIHALHSVQFKSIISENANFKIDVIGSPNVDLTINGDVNLNAHFYFKLNGKINLNPQSSVKYQFSQNRFDNDIYLNAQADVELGTLVTSKSVYVSGNFELKNSSILAKDVVITNTQLDLSNNLIQASNLLTVNNSQITNSALLKTNIICQKSMLPSATLSALNSVSNLKVTPISPQACSVPSPTVVFPTCQGVCDGIAIFNLSGCSNPPYIIQWINGTCPSNLPPAEAAYTGTTYSVNALCGCSSQYLVVFENAIGEQTAGSFGMVDPPATILNFSTTQPTCNGLCNGQVRASVLTGAIPLSINWNPPNVTHTNINTRDTLKNACAGTYTVTATNVNGCINTFTTTLVQPAVLLANGVSSSVTCNAACNGSATASPSGGTGPYSYSWLSASSTPSTSTTSSITALCPAVLTMTVTDSKTCTATYSVNIIQPPAITLTVSHTDLTCGSICDGTASVTATGGIGPFTYSWTPSGGTASQAVGLCAGNYTCTVTNNGNCIKTITVSILSPPPLTASPTQTNLACNAACIGAINLNPSGGTGAYTYSWSPAAPTTSVLTSLCAGAYNYTVTDALGCKFSNTVTITQPPATTLAVVITSITCNGICDGTAIANMSGGTGAYSYTWQPVAPPITGQGTASVSALCSGSYTVIVKDANNCTKTQTFTITQPTPIVPNITSVSPTCNGLCNGSINSIPSGGTGPYTFTLQSSGAPLTTNPPYTGLCAGSYTLLVKDAKGCVRTQTLNLTQPNPILLSLNSTTLNCSNVCNASISTVVNGGTPAYTFSWSASSATTSALTNQCAGVQSATVTDANGCTATATTTIAAKPDMTISIVPTNPNCNSQCTGIATTSVSGGTPNYTISLNNGSSGNIIPNLCIGTYTATVTDFFGCVKTQTVSIVAPPAMTLTPVNGTVSCAGGSDGVVSVNPSGGTAGYFYSWSPTTPTQTTAVANGLPAGNYVVTVTDALGCIASTVAAVAQPTVLTASIGNVQPSCNVCIGAATATGIGGTGPTYTYSWSPGGQTSATPTNLCVGIQTVIVTDTKGCTTTQTVQINQTVITLVTTNGNTLSCNSACSGVATGNPSGGAGGYSYTWTPAGSAPIQNTQTATGLCAGTHTIMVSDINGCSSTNTVTFTNPPAITLTVGQTNVSCNGACNGVATATATGGTGAVSYLWQPGNITTNSISGLCAGNYTVTATDVNNCSQTQVITITETNSLTASFTFTNPTTCTSTNGAIGVVISGGTSPYTFTWTPGNSTISPLVNVGAGTYSVSIRDLAGCTQTIVTTLSNPTGPTVTVVSNSIACFGSCTGTATLSITGNGPFTVNGSPIPTFTTSLSGLCAGITTPIITDANSCITNQTISIAQPTQLTANGVVTNDLCNAACTGSINLTPSGGTLPYSYTWTPAGGSVQDPVNLCSGNYTVIVTDGNNCVLTRTFVVTQPPALSLNFNKKDVLCNGQCTGGVKAIVSGGTSPYTYTWTAAAPFVTANIDTIVNLCSGIYTLSATDINGCTITGTVDIGQPVALTSTITSVNEKCNGQCTGSAVINASGGVLPYSFSYNTTPVTPTQSIGGLCVGTYTGNVTDANGCLSSNNFNITEPLPIVVTTTISNPKCNAVCDGSVATTVTGGSSGYSYTWIASGGPVPNPTGLCAGNYTVIVTDDSLCTGQALVTLVDPIILIANTSFTNPTCNGGCNGIVSANPIGGTLPFTFFWANPVVNAQTVSNLCAGDYTLTLTDVNGCQDIQVVTLTDPAAITVNPAISPATCGTNNGSINAVGASGVAPYTYNWLPPVTGSQTTNTVVTGLGAGIYTVIVTDANACSSTILIPLSNSNGPSGATITSTNVICNGQCNGAADISNPLAGTSPYVLSWINPVSASTVITNLCAGTYTAQIEDANNCLFFKSVTITEPQLIDDNEVFTSAACLGNCNGAIALNPSGGNGGYTYSWSPAAITGTITGLCPGVYTATVTDIMGCTLVASYSLPSLTTITSSTFATNNTCFGDCNGSILATNIAGGLPPYSFAWSDPTGQSTAVANNLCNGTYSVTITDANGCFNVLPATVTSPSQVTFTPSVTEPNCGACNGVAVVSPVGGIPAYNFLWSNAQTGNTASNLCAGVYDVRITDSNGCVSTSSVIVNNSTAITGETITFANVSCVGTPCDGTVTVTAIGGTLPISYHWIHDNSVTQTLTGLCAGTYFCNMTDANGCTRTASVVIGATTTLTLTPQVTQSSCSSSTGSITINVSGGSGTYTYNWLPAGNTATLTNLAPGNYTLTVSDGTCSQTQVYAINSVNGPIVNATQNNITCAGLCNGSISLTISGGNPAYTTLWSNGAGSTTLSGLCAGPYSYTVTDAAGCKAVQSFSLTTNTPIVFSVPDVDNPLCNNNCNGVITTIPSGGVLPYTYSWAVSSSTTSVANGLCAGNYSVTISDANGCPAQQTYTLTGPTSVSLTAVITDATCNSSSTGAIDLNVAGGTPGYTYTWTPNGTAFTQDLVNITAGTYSVVVIDANGCNVDSSFVVNEPTAITDNSTIVPAACFGNCNGSITLAPTGGSGPYTFTWSPSTATTATATNLCPGPQTATVTDALGCSVVFTYTVPSLTTITSTTLASNNLCFNDCNGILTATNIAGGAAPYTIQWNDPLGQIGNTAVGLCTGSYTATITDVNGCYNPIPAVISSNSQVTFTPNITQPSCDQCDGSAVVNPIGGIAPYAYLWSNNQVVNTATNLCGGVYAVQITDGNGCVNTTNILINSSSGITGEAIVKTDVTCDAVSCDGTANVTAVGGVAPISYNWTFNNSSSQSINGLCAGTYFCNMTDANGCSRTASVVIGSVTSLTISSQVTQSSCSSSTGSITVNVSGGTGSYTYTWLPAGTTPTVTNLAPGTYTLNVSDGNCTKTQIFTVQSFNAPTIASTQKSISCSGVCDGSIALTISGGTPAYTTVWSNGDSTMSISALCAGAYSVEVTDGAGCKAIRNFSLNPVSPIIFSAPDLDDPLCHDACDGSLTAIPVGGTMPYTFTWTPVNINVAAVNNLCAGNYSITVADANGCSVSDDYSLINPPTLTLTAVINPAGCSTTPDGSIDITVLGGTAPYTYSWTPGVTTAEDLVNVLAGTYSLTVIDNLGNGCPLDTSFVLTATLTVDAVAGNDTIFCENGTLMLDGSNSIGGITYQWTEIPSGVVISNTLVTTVMPATGTSTYVLTATDGSCIDTDSILVTSNALPAVDAGPTISIPLLGSGTIGGNPTTAGGNTVSWIPVLGLDNPTGSNPTTATTVTTLYTVTVVDANGCVNLDTVTVYVYPEIKIPNGFSPNGDGKNDVWQIDFIDQFPECEVEVYNRWGEQLFYSRGYAVPFNGQYKGKNLAVGTYYYVIKLNHPNYPTPYTSPLTIFR